MSMAGRGTRFSKEGYETPKPFIEINGKPMFAWALKSLSGLPVQKLIIVALAEHVAKFNLKELLKEYWQGEYIIHEIDEVTEGQLCTVLSARHILNIDDDLLILSADTLVVSDLKERIVEFKHSSSGIISIMESAEGDNWSFVKLNAEKIAVEVAEKSRISDNISTGLYYFSKVAEFLFYADKVIDSNMRVKGEFYIIPTYQMMIDDKRVIRVAQSIQMWDMGTPEAKRKFEQALKAGQVSGV